MKPLIKLNIQIFEKENWPAYLVAFIAQNNPLINITSEMTETDYLIFKNGQLHFMSKSLGDMSFDFSADLHYHQHQHYALSREPLAKALGIVGHHQKLIWDATCGTAKDSLLISHFGAKLLAFERHPAVYLLLTDAKKRSAVNFDIIFADVSKMEISSERPAVIYYDPMYPEKKKSALARKEMRIFKEIVGDDPDSPEFLEWALTVATERVVVKRALHAKPIRENPSASYKGKSTRYDMYKIFK